MTATDELRRMLDERGVEYENTNYGKWPITKWFSTDNQKAFNTFIEDDEGRISVTIPVLTPEQAIEATLGRGTCHECAGMDDVFECSACGARYESWALKRFASYCPDCGRRVRA